MEQQGEGGAEGPTHGCMQCKARQRYMVEELRNRNTLWRCAVCNHVVNLTLQRHLSALPKIARVESRFCGRQR